MGCRSSQPIHDVHDVHHYMVDSSFVDDELQLKIQKFIRENQAANDNRPQSAKAGRWIRQSYIQPQKKKFIK